MLPSPSGRGKEGVMNYEKINNETSFCYEFGFLCVSVPLW
jgi:hypothetical protein